MRITETGTDYVRIDEDNIDSFLNIKRIHLIKLDFFKPNETKIKKVIKLYPKTMRYIIQNYIKTYNFILRNTNKKYYIENYPGIDLISFFKKNNKVIVNFNNLRKTELEFLLNDFVFEDVLKNCEVIQIDQDIFESKKYLLENWTGNVIIHNGNELLDE